MTPILATLFDASYLNKGLALIHSLCTHHADGFRLYVLALDDATESAVKAFSDTRVTVIHRRETSTQIMVDSILNRTWTEFCWTMASVFTQYCLETLNLPHVAYCDSDMFLLHSLDALYREVAHESIAITPHRFSPARSKTHGINGTYNVGWVYFKNDATARACLDEWVSLCLDWCYRKSERDAHGVWRFGDQAYWDQLVPKYGVHGVKHLGVNLAPWNSENYEYQIDAQGRLFVIERCETGGVKRIDIAALYHFHSLQEKDGQVVRFSDYAIPPMLARHIYEPYAKVLREIGKRK